MWLSYHITSHHNNNYMTLCQKPNKTFPSSDSLPDRHTSCTIITADCGVAFFHTSTWNISGAKHFRFNVYCSERLVCYWNQELSWDFNMKMLQSNVHLHKIHDSFYFGCQSSSWAYSWRNNSIRHLTKLMLTHSTDVTKMLLLNEIESLMEWRRKNVFMIYGKRMNASWGEGEREGDRIENWNVFAWWFFVWLRRRQKGRNGATQIWKKAKLHWTRVSQDLSTRHLRSLQEFYRWIRIYSAFSVDACECFSFSIQSISKKKYNKITLVRAHHMKNRFHSMAKEEETKRTEKELSSMVTWSQLSSCERYLCHRQREYELTICVCCACCPIRMNSCFELRASVVTTASTSTSLSLSSHVWQMLRRIFHRSKRT